jgi:hypothetical protein
MRTRDTKVTPLCRQTDAIAGLIRDLKERAVEHARGLTSEFGHLVAKHDWAITIEGFHVVAGGGGVRAWTVFAGAMDEASAIAPGGKPQRISDLQATRSHQMGLITKKMEIGINGRPVRASSQRPRN